MGNDPKNKLTDYMTQDEKAMMALQGKRSDDIVAMMKADQDQGSLNVGVEAKAKEYVKNRQEG